MSKRGPTYEFGPFPVDAGKRLLLRHGEPVPLAPKVLETLLALDREPRTCAHEGRTAQGDLGRHGRGRRGAHAERLDTAEDPGREARRPSVHRHRARPRIPVRRGGARNTAEWRRRASMRRLVPDASLRWCLGGLAALVLGATVYVLRPAGAIEPERREIHVVRRSCRLIPPRYDSVLRAKYLSVRTTDADTQGAIALLEHAIALDPGFALAYADLAAAYVTRLTFVTPEETGDLEQKAFAAAEKALSLDPNLAEAYLARGDLLWTHSHHFAHERAAQEFRRALRLNPNSDQAHRRLARVYVHVGFFEEALQHAATGAYDQPQQRAGAEFAGAGPPLDGKGRRGARVPVEHSWTRPAGARRGERRVRPPPVGPTRGSVGAPAACLAQYPNDPSGALHGIEAMLLAESEPRKAQELIESVAKRKSVNPSHHAAYFAASAWAQMRRAAEAVQWLREAAETGFPFISCLRATPIWIRYARTRVSGRFLTTCQNIRRRFGRRFPRWQIEGQPITCPNRIHHGFTVLLVPPISGRLRHRVATASQIPILPFVRIRKNPQRRRQRLGQPMLFCGTCGHMWSGTKPPPPKKVPSIFSKS